jgi:hypothetical protein
MISINAQYVTLYVTLHKYISHPSFSYLLCSNSTIIKLKLGLQIGERLLIADHLDQSNYLANQKQRGS